MRAALILAALLALPAHAGPAPIFVSDEADGDSIELFADAGPCIDDAKTAVYVFKGGKRIPGCWRLLLGGAPVVSLAFFDGDTLRRPAMQFRKVGDS